MDKQIISIQLPIELINKLKETASNDCTTISAIIRKILLDYYKNNH